MYIVVIKKQIIRKFKMKIIKKLLNKKISCYLKVITKHKIDKNHKCPSQNIFLSQNMHKCKKNNKKMVKL